MHTGEFAESGLYGNPQAFNPKRGIDRRPRRTFGDLAEEARFLLNLGIGKPLIMQSALNAWRNDTTIEQELLAGGIVKPESYYEAFAQYLGLAYIAAINPDELHTTPEIDTQLTQQSPIVRIYRRHERPLTVFTPEAARGRDLRQQVEDSASLAASLAVAAPGVIRDAIWKASASKRRNDAIGRLFDLMPAFSARIVFSGYQGFAIGSLLTALPFIAFLFPTAFLLANHVIFTSFYLLVLTLRGTALGMSPPNDRGGHVATSPDGLPVYTVLVALYREERMIPQLVAALDRIDWPKSKLDIKLVCEADDLPTLNAARLHARDAHFEIIEVPNGGPRTKPKALTYALAAARGEYVVIYDAEDRPHPQQLRAAYEQFQKGDASLACLQAPLIITNARASWISAIFALEYAALFRGILPLIARLRLPMPLGGTSNHFRTRILIKCGGWDPYNVTEDADIGLRLARMGYHCGVLGAPTLEDAPAVWSVWLAQRSRWFKGWLQTLLVHFRDPVRLYREIGLAGYLTVIVTTGGMLFSALTHPLIIVFIGYTVWRLAASGTGFSNNLQAILFIMDMFNIAGSYALFALMGGSAMSKGEKRRVGRPWLGIPVYWLMLSVAAWKAIYEIRRDPFLWRKTPHEPSGDPETLKTGLPHRRATGN